MSDALTDEELQAQLDAIDAENKRRGGLLGGPLKGLRSAIVGPEDTGPQREVPNLISQSGGDPIAFADMLASARGNTLASVDIIEKQFPSAKYRYFPSGAEKPQNLQVNFGGSEAQPEGEWFYLNKPGMSLMDWREAVQEFSVLAAGGFGGAKAGRAVMGWLGQLVGGGLGAGAGAVATEGLSIAAGSEQPIDLQRALLITGLGLAGEGAIMAFGRVWPMIANNPGMVQGGRITPQGERVLLNEGIDPSQITQEFVREWDALSRRAVDPGEAAVAAEAQSLPIPTSSTRGDLSRNILQQGREEAMRQGSLGEAAQGVMEQFRRQQARELYGNADAIQAGLGGGTAQVARPGQGVAQVQARLAGERDRAQRAVRDLYTHAREANGGVNADLVGDLVDRAGSNLSVNFVPGTVPSATKVMDDLADLLTAGGGRGRAAPPKVIQEGEASTIYNKMEDWRARAVGERQAARSRGDRRDAEAIRQTIALYDDFTDGLIDGALVRGQDDIVVRWKNAIAGRREFGRRFESNKIVAKMIEMSDESGAWQLKMTPQEALDMLFTSGAVGAKKGAQNALQKLRQVLGPDSPEWLALKEEGFLRLMHGQGRRPGEMLGPELEPLFSGAIFNSNLRRSMDQGFDLMHLLFSNRELALINQFNRVGLRNTTQVAGVRGPNTAHNMARMVQEMFGPTSRVMSIVTRYLGIGAKQLGNIGRGFEAEGLVNAVPVMRAAPRGVGGGAGAAGGTILPPGGP